MAGLGITTTQLSRLRRRWSEQLSQAAGALAGGEGAGGSPLLQVDGFGSNPGRLRMHLHVPDGLGRRPALVVALHGCTQDAAGFAAASGWR